MEYLDTATDKQVWIMHDIEVHNNGILLREPPHPVK